MKTRAQTAGYRVQDGQLLRVRWGMIVEVFDPPWWAVHRWVWWVLCSLCDFIWRCARHVLRLVIAVPVGRPGARYRGREEVVLKRGPLQGVEVSSVRVVEALRSAERSARGEPSSRSAVRAAQSQIRGVRRARRATR